MTRNRARNPLLLGLALLPLLGAVPGLADEAETGTPLSEFFHGKVVSLKRGVVTLHYDFSDEAQLEDWVTGVPFPVRKRKPPTVLVADGKLSLDGSAGARHAAAWAGDVEVECKLEVIETRNIGGMITPTSGTNDFATFTAREFFFHSWDRGQKGGQHSIIKFGDQWREGDATDDYIGFRYVARKLPPERLKAGQVFPFAFGLKRGKVHMDLPGVKLRGKDLGVELRVHRPGFYCVRGALKVDDVTIVGTLDEEWLSSQGVALRVE